MTEKAVEVVVFKPRHLKEAEALRALTQKKHHELHPSLFNETADEIGVWRELGTYVARSSLFSRRNSFGFAAISGSQLLGYLLYLDYANSPRMMHPYSRWFIITDIAVDPAHQRRGISTRLYEKLKSIAEKAAGSYISANVWLGNEASEAFFLKQGFSPHNKSYGAIVS